MPRKKLPNATAPPLAPNIAGPNMTHAPETENVIELRPRRMLNEKQVLAIIPLGRSTLLRMEREGKFPKSTYISANRRIWYEDQIVGWQNAVDEFNPNRGRGKRRRPRVASSRA
jgi:prophage regulatory protein